ncbi:hypothetical protein DBV15_10758 [Temnothorax longispinosus]|uniref:Uncharacterized protein n=1 Tax=Temnothorax longispinosus TaxID=300112 RepID=A0A4S2LD95_9HYME|nr:hypothetical protein DBV15_10758 [Temnothorax longispinosus]
MSSMKRTLYHRNHDIVPQDLSFAALPKAKEQLRKFVNIVAIRARRSQAKLSYNEFRRSDGEIESVYRKLTNGGIVCRRRRS